MIPFSNSYKNPGVACRLLKDLNKHNDLLIVFILILLSCGQLLKAQNRSKYDFFLGYGYYEGFNIGGERYFKAGKHSIGVSLGIDRSLNKFSKSESFALSYNFAFKQVLKNDLGEYKWHVNNNVVFWQLEDEFYLWCAISLIPSVNTRFILYKDLRMSIDIGPAFIIVLSNYRKTFREVGWPYHVMPNFRMLFIL